MKLVFKSFLDLFPFIELPHASCQLFFGLSKCSYIIFFAVAIIDNAITMMLHHQIQIDGEIDKLLLIIAFVDFKRFQFAKPFSFNYLFIHVLCLMFWCTSNECNASAAIHFIKSVRFQHSLHFVSPNHSKYLSYISSFPCHWQLAMHSIQWKEQKALNEQRKNLTATMMTTTRRIEKVRL